MSKSPSINLASFAAAGDTVQVNTGQVFGSSTTGALVNARIPGRAGTTTFVAKVLAGNFAVNTFGLGFGRALYAFRAPADVYDGASLICDRAIASVKDRTGVFAEEVNMLVASEQVRPMPGPPCLTCAGEFGRPKGFAFWSGGGRRRRRVRRGTRGRSRARSPKPRADPSGLHFARGASGFLTTPSCRPVLFQLDVECIDEKNKMLNLVVDEAKGLQLLPASKDVQGKPQVSNPPSAPPLPCWQARLVSALEQGGWRLTPPTVLGWLRRKPEVVLTDPFAFVHLPGRRRPSRRWATTGSSRFSG
jgi:hypothetical protein